MTKFLDNSCYLILTTFMTIFLIILFLIFAFVCAKNIRCGIYTIIFSMPLYLLRFSVFGIPTTVLEIMIYILFLAWILNATKKNNFYLALAESFNGFSRFRKNNPILLFGIILLFLGLALSTLHSSDLRTSLGICKGWFVDSFLFFVVFRSVIKEEKQIKLSLASWVFSGVAVALISIFYLLSNNLSFDGRLSAFYLSPNYLAMYISPVFLIALFFLLNSLSFPRRRESTVTISDNLRIVLNIKKISNIQYQILSVVILTIILIPLYFTYSYGAFLGIFAGVVWLLYKTYICRFNNTNNNTFRKNKKPYLSFLRRRESIATTNNKLCIGCKTKKQLNSKIQPFLKILAFATIIIFVSITAAKFSQIINSENRSSFHSRLMIWNASLEMIKDNPIFGIGPGTFQSVYLSYADKFDEPYLEWAVTQPHNTFLAFYLQTGLIGFIGFILILVWFFYRRRGGSRLAPTVATVLIIYILIHGLADTMYWKNDLSLMFWLVIGLACCDFNEDTGDN
ncbi:MAG: O-antigen ligase family protein, partial [Patescibacteria group bacterium]|nr:O-antigen ligase family protein [Patescibacteria group bacterium]